MSSIQQIIHYLEKLAPPAYQESYDNSGLIVGDAAVTVTGILISLDCTEAVVEEAIQRGCNLIVSHHPIIFKGLKKLNGKNYVERTVIKAIQHNIALYAIHTNLDHVPNGVNWMIAHRLGLEKVRILAPKREVLRKLAFFVPPDYAERVMEQVFAEGAGQIGNYSQCSFRTDGMGTFKPNQGADPYLGKVGTLETAEEQRIEVMFPAYLEKRILSALKKAHPYEEVAYYVQVLENENQEVGAGAIGDLPEAMSLPEFLSHLKTSMQATVIKYTTTANSVIKRVAVCGGAGSFLLPNAMAMQADAFRNIRLQIP